jgi:Cytochrome c554 and c-prime
MRKVVLLIVGLAALLFCVDKLCANVYKYIGVKKCKMCHSSSAKGNQYKIWAESSHAKAFERLASPEAKALAAKAGVSGNPQEAAQCVKCHITAYSVDASLLDSGFAKEDGVQCESCHGAGSDYVPMSVMKDRAKAIEAGLVIPTQEACVKCHNSESPSFKGFDFDSYYKKIAHPLPKSQ